LIDEEIASLRQLIGDLRPIYHEDLGFVPALEMLPRQMQERSGLSLHLTIHGAALWLAHDVELAAYRIVQQALANVAAHAQASNLRLDVSFTTEHLTLVIRDDGRGFTPPDQPADLIHQGHFGLMGMRERVLLYGGHLTITSSPGEGATIVARLPLLR
jgi:signal transduction histidine kinase